MENIQSIFEYLVKNPIETLFYISIFIFIASVLGILKISIPLINTENANIKHSIIIAFISGLAAFYFYNQFPNKADQSTTTVSAVSPNEKTKETGRFLEHSREESNQKTKITQEEKNIKTEIQQEENLESILSRYVSYNNKRDYDKSWFFISDFFKREVINKKEFSYIKNDEDALAYYKKYWSTNPATFELGLVDDTRNITTIFINFNNGKVQKNTYELEKIEANNIFSGWRIKNVINRETL